MYYSPLAFDARDNPGQAFMPSPAEQIKLYYSETKVVCVIEVKSVICNIKYTLASSRHHFQIQSNLSQQYNNSYDNRTALIPRPPHAANSSASSSQSTSPFISSVIPSAREHEPLPWSRTSLGTSRSFRRGRVRWRSCRSRGRLWLWSGLRTRTRSRISLRTHASALTLTRFRGRGRVRLWDGTGT